MISGYEKVSGFMLSHILEDFSYKTHEDEEWAYYHIGDGSGELFKIYRDGTAFQQVMGAQCCEINIVGDWIYHCRCHCGENLYKIRKDGTEQTKLNDDYTREVNVVGDWIYYCADEMKLHKIRTDGTERTKLCDDACRSVSVIDEWIYYGILNNYRGFMCNDECDGIYRIRVDGTGRTRLSAGAKHEWFRIEGEWIYYFIESRKRGDDGNGELYRMRLDGTDKTKIFDNYRGEYQCSDTGEFEIEDEWMYVFREKGDALCKMRIGETDKIMLAERCDYFEISGDWIYYCIEKTFRQGGALHKVRKDGTANSKIDSIRRCYNFKIINGWIYYFNNNGIFKIRADSKSSVKICDDIACRYEFVGDWIYYENDSDNGASYRIRTDGSGREWLADRRGVECNTEDWVYYVNESDYNKLYKIRPDGTQRTKISDGVFEQFWVFGDFICFLVDAEKENAEVQEEPKLKRSGGMIRIIPSLLYRMRLDGTEKEKICDDVFEHYYKSTQGICYINTSDDKWYEIKPDGTRSFVRETKKRSGKD